MSNKWNSVKVLAGDQCIYNFIEIRSYTFNKHYYELLLEPSPLANYLLTKKFVVRK